MDPETILNEYVGALNTNQTRETIRMRMVEAEAQTRAASAQMLFPSTTRREDMEDASELQAWMTTAGAAMGNRLNTAINTGIISSPRGPSLVDYGSRYTFNYADAGAFLTVGDGGDWAVNGTVPIPQKTITANFVEIVSNPNSDESPFMCQTGKATIIEGSEKFFEDIDPDAIKSHLTAMVFRVLKTEPVRSVYMLSGSDTANKRWICKKPLKAVDMIREFLDEALCEMAQRFYATQKKLQHFKLIKG